MADCRPLLVNEDSEDVLEGATAGDEISALPDRVIVTPKRRTIVVEPILLLYSLGILGNDTILELYLHSRLKHLYPILVNRSSDSNSTCVQTNVSNPFMIAERSVNEDVSVWQNYLTLPTILSIFTALLYGAYSDVAGRRPILLLPSIFAAVKYTVNACVIYFNLPLYMLLVGTCSETLGGGYYTLVMGAYAYIADCTSDEKLGFRMTVLDGIMGVSVSLSQAALGFSIDKLGYFYTYLILASFILVNLVYVIFFVPETVVRDRNKRFHLTGYVKSIWSSFTNKEGRRHIGIGLLLFATLWFNLVFQSQPNIEILYAMGPPLCWGTDEIGVFVGIYLAVTTVASIVGMSLFSRCRSVPLTAIAAIGIVSAMMAAVVKSWANSWFWMIMASLFAMFSLLPGPMTRTIASNLVNDDEQGRIMAGFSSVSALCSIVSMLTMNTIYQNTVKYMPGFIFIVAAGFLLLSLIVLLCFVVFNRKRKREIERRESQGSDPAT